MSGGRFGSRGDRAIPSFSGRPGVDETAALFAARATAIARNIPLWLPPGTYKISDVPTLWNGAQIDGYGCTLDIQTDHSVTGRGIFGTAVDNVSIRGLTLAQSNASGRNAVYGMLSFLSSAGVGRSNVTVTDVRVTSGESVVIYAENMTDFSINGIRGSGTYADGIHLCRGTRRGTVRGIRVDAVGDDAIALVGITSENAGATTWQPMTDITIADFVVNSLTTLGSGVVVIGASRINVGNGTIKSPKANGVYVSDSPGLGAPAPSNVIVSGVNVETAGTGSGFLIGPSNDVTITGCSSLDAGDSGVALVGSTRTYITSSKFRGSVGFGIYEASGTSNAITACDIGGNTAGPSQVVTAAITACKIT